MATVDIVHELILLEDAIVFDVAHEIVVDAYSPVVFEVDVELEASYPRAVRLREGDFLIDVEIDVPFYLQNRVMREGTYDVAHRVVIEDIGPGTGLVIGGSVRTFWDTLREGDTFPVYIRWEGVAGVNAIAHVVSRSVSSEEPRQSIDVQPFYPDEPGVYEALARGEQQAVRIPSANNMTRQLIRERREREREQRKQATRG